MKFSITKSHRSAGAATGIFSNGVKLVGLFALIAAFIPVAQAGCGDLAGLSAPFQFADANAQVRSMQESRQNNWRRRRTPQSFKACRPRRSSRFGSFNLSPKATRLTILQSPTAPSSTSDTCNGTAMEPNSSIPPSIQTFVWAYGDRRDS